MYIANTTCQLQESRLQIMRVLWERRLPRLCQVCAHAGGVCTCLQSHRWEEGSQRGDCWGPDRVPRIGISIPGEFFPELENLDDCRRGLELSFLHFYGSTRHNLTVNRKRNNSPGLEITKEEELYSEALRKRYIQPLGFNHFAGHHERLRLLGTPMCRITTMSKRRRQMRINMRMWLWRKKDSPNGRKTRRKKEVDRRSPFQMRRPMTMPWGRVPSDLPEERPQLRRTRDLKRTFSIATTEPWEINETLYRESKPLPKPSSFMKTLMNLRRFIHRTESTCVARFVCGGGDHHWRECRVEAFDEEKKKIIDAIEHMDATLVNQVTEGDKEYAALIGDPDMTATQEEWYDLKTIPGEQTRDSPSPKQSRRQRPSTDDSQGSRPSKRTDQKVETEAEMEFAYERAVERMLKAYAPHTKPEYLSDVSDLLDGGEHRVNGIPFDETGPKDRRELDNILGSAAFRSPQLPDIDKIANDPSQEHKEAYMQIDPRCPCGYLDVIPQHGIRFADATWSTRKDGPPEFDPSILINKRSPWGTYVTKVSGKSIMTLRYNSGKKWVKDKYIKNRYHEGVRANDGAWVNIHEIMKKDWIFDDGYKYHSEWDQGNNNELMASRYRTMVACAQHSWKISRKVRYQILAVRLKRGESKDPEMRQYWDQNGF